MPGPVEKPHPTRTTRLAMCVECVQPRMSETRERNINISRRAKLGSTKPWVSHGFTQFPPNSLNFLSPRHNFSRFAAMYLRVVEYSRVIRVICLQPKATFPTFCASPNGSIQWFSKLKVTETDRLGTVFCLISSATSQFVVTTPKRRFKNQHEHKILSPCMD